MSHGAAHYEQLVHDYFAAVERGDLDAVLACFTEDAVFRVSYNPEPVVGREALRGFFAGVVERMRNRREVATRILVDGDRGISELVFDAETADGRPLHFENCNAYVFRDGLFAEVTVYGDSVTMKRQLGVG
ncbi:MAG: nuclear transport factor 2 family protein [Thermoleophilia bacterium]